MLSTSSSVKLSLQMRTGTDEEKRFSLSAAIWLLLHSLRMMRDGLDDREKLFYDYTCGVDDVVRMRDVPTPKMTDADLVVEKELLRGKN